MQTPAEIINQWFERVWNRNEASFIDEGLAEICEVTGLDAEVIRSREEFHRFHQMLNEAFEKIQVKVEHLMELGDEFSGLVSVKAIHRVTGKSVSFTSSFYGAVSEGQIYRASNIVDYLAILIQIGALPEDVLARGLSGQNAL